MTKPRPWWSELRRAATTLAALCLSGSLVAAQAAPAAETPAERAASGAKSGAAGSRSSTASIRKGEGKAAGPAAGGSPARLLEPVSQRDAATKRRSGSTGSKTAAAPLHSSAKSRLDAAGRSASGGAARGASRGRAGKAASSASQPRSSPVAIGTADVLPEQLTGLHGTASYYGHRFQGRKTAAGDRYDTRAFTAATNHYPLGSRLAVWRLDTGHCAIVTVNDRMSQRHVSRIIDVSRSTAEYLGMLRAGVTMVRVAPYPHARHAGGTTVGDACRAAFDPAPCPECDSPTPRLPGPPVPD